MAKNSDDGLTLNGKDDGNFRFNGYQFSSALKCLSHLDGSESRLRARSLAVFSELSRSPNQVVSKATLMKAVWPDVHVTDDSLTQCVSDIRKAIGDTDRSVLKTIPRQGYLLIPDSDTRSNTAAVSPIKSIGKIPWIVAAFILICATVYAWTGSSNTESKQLESMTPLISGTPEVRILNAEDSENSNAVVDNLSIELKASLNQYRSISVTESEKSDYDLLLNTNDDSTRILAELRAPSKEILFAQTYPAGDSPSASVNLAKRIAAAIASPGIGAVDRQLLQSSRLKPIETLSEAECFAHGFGCSKCSGEEDNITERAEACLTHVIDKNPASARAWGLKATILAHQYWWGNTLPEPLRSNLSLRKDIPEEAIAAANKAESLSNGQDSAIYWGMAEAYYSSCQVDKMESAIERGLKINPNDPNLLAAFGNWLAYSGQWEKGSSLIEKALEIEPNHYRKWWWMGLAKTHYFNEEFQEAYAMFLKSFNERNWVSHLQLAYTLPHINRMDEARDAVKKLQSLQPGITVEKALEHYRLLCFPNTFLENMREALMAAGLPSLGNSNNFDSIVMPRAKLIELDDYAAEYVDHGEGEPILFVHGSMSDYRSFGYYLAPISENHRFITYSRRYFGTQDWRDEGERFTTEQQVIDLIDFIETLELGPVHVVSWSSSGSIVGHASIKRPDLFKSAVYFEPVDLAIFNGQNNDEEAIAEWDMQWPVVSEALENNDPETAAQRFIEIVFESGKGGFQNEREAIQEVVRQNARSLYAENREPDNTRWTFDCSEANESLTPSLVVKGELTHYFFTRQADLFKECLLNAESAVIPGVNHRGPADAVTKLSDLIINFVARHH